MCTALTYTSSDHYFGRNFDFEISYNERVIVTPRNFPFVFRKESDLFSHYAMIGIGIMEDGYPLYYDATNEYGLSMAGLNFPENAYYFPTVDNKTNITPFEFIPFLLGKCKNILEARELLADLNLIDLNFNDSFPLSPLHWMISDTKETIVVESTAKGLKIFDNPVGVLTNNPPFDFQLFNLNNYRSLSTKTPDNNFSNKINMDAYSRGMGGMGLPGDLSSSSRFVKVAFTKLNAAIEKTEEESVSQFFHILKSVEQQKGLCDVGNEEYEYTIYSSCCNMDKGIYYYTTYYNSQVTAINMHKEDLNSDKLSIFSLVNSEKINYIN